jgi:hypothetical protein
MPAESSRGFGRSNGWSATRCISRRGVDVLGGVRVTAPDAFLDVLMEGGSAYHFFGRSAEKVVLMRRAATRKIASGVVVYVNPRPFAA